MPTKYFLTTVLAHTTFCVIHVSKQPKNKDKQQQFVKKTKQTKQKHNNNKTNKQKKHYFINT